MAKRKQKLVITKRESIPAPDTVEINLGKAEGPFLEPKYSNQILMSASAHDITLDFYWLGQKPPTSDTEGAGIAKLVDRIIISYSNAKGLVTALANLISDRETETGFEFPLTRGPREEDILQIWDENGKFNLKRLDAK